MKPSKSQRAAQAAEEAKKKQREEARFLSDPGMPFEKTANGATKKATFALDVGLLEGLEVAWFNLRRQGLPSVTKAEIVEAALEMAFEDLQASGLEGKLASKLGSKAE